MKILCVSPSSPVFDKTLHYFQAVFSSTSAYLKTRFPQAEVVTEAAGLTGAPERVIVRHLSRCQAPDFLVLWVRVWEAPAARQLAVLARELCPNLKILVWGESCVYIPQYFRRAPFDAMVVSGDWERVLADAIERLGQGLDPLHGMEFRWGADWSETAQGLVLPPAEWPFPDPAAIDPAGYHTARLHREKLTDDLSFTISRGCPINCAPWCPTPRKEGVRDRRRPVDQTLDYLAAGPDPYQLFQLHSPLLVQDREWIRQLVERKRQRCPEVPFKSVDLVNPYAEEALVAELASVGMRGIGFGIETLAADPRRRLTPKVDERLLEQVAANFHRHGVEGKAYTQVGLPGQRREDVLYTHRLLLDLGFTPRPTGATPFWKLRSKSVEELDAMDLSRWDRKSYFDPRCGLSLAEFFQLITSPRSFQAQEALWVA
ncbi:MAG: radical SAM protein [Candidatus Eremiobacterota bacterium]